MLTASQRNTVKQKLSMCRALGDVYLIADPVYWDEIEQILRDIAEEGQTGFSRRDTENNKLSEIRNLLVGGGVVLICKSSFFHGHLYSFMRECSERDFRQVYLRDTLETLMVSKDFHFVFLLSMDDDELLDNPLASLLATRW